MPDRAQPPRAREPAAAPLVALGYAVLGLSWILLSDGLVEALFTDPDHRRWVQTSKGTAFVLVTAVALWAVVRGLLRRLDGARQRLAARQAEWRTIFTEHPAPLFVVAPDTGEVLESNRAATQLYGRSIEHLVGRRFGDFEAIVDTPDPEPSATGEGPLRRYSGLHRHVGGEGRTRWVDLHAVAVSHQGQPAVLVHVLDLTAEREVHEALSFARSHDPLTGLP
ncbi:MAG: PAS domain S-box protein, partial [Myxococcales bacterium]|nr:PAS domain S-box protein [Myxococcales bacterium]